MIAFRVTLNGNLLCTAGAEDLSVLNTIIGAVGKLGSLTKGKADRPADIYLSVGGLTSRSEKPDDHLRWAEQKPLRPGDRIDVEIVDITETRAILVRNFQLER